MSEQRQSSIDEEKGDYYRYDDATSTSSTPLFHESDDETSSRRRQSSQVSRWATMLHWIFHMVSAVAIIFLAIRAVSRETTLECWERFNSYSEFTKVLEIAAPTCVDRNSAHERLCEGSPIYRSRNQRIKTLSERLRR